MIKKEIQDIINKALALKDTDINSSKAALLAAKQLFPDSFEM